MDFNLVYWLHFLRSFTILLFSKDIIKRTDIDRIMLTKKNNNLFV